MHVRFVDCRPREAYLAGHVPGAAHGDPERDLTGTDGGGRHPLPTEGAFAAWASAAGIGSSTLVIAYDERTGWADRLWWLLRHFGHDHAGAIRFDAWHGPLLAGEEGIDPEEFRARPRRDDTATAAELLSRLDDPSLTLVDARAPERWRGEAEPIDPVAGRIPGARNRYFLDDAPLPQELADAEDLVVYCGSGVTACAVLHELHLAGRTDARLYPGSFSEWYPLGPVERG
ncbi:MAG: rhodanese-like domain-containing protein [Actinomycetota bacterium]|nr:rhodanese-like domain-containing protein [Actinomycetota bacterium]